MKRETFLRSAICAAFVGFVFCLGASMARAQDVAPLLDCVERERDSNGNPTSRFIVHFGYVNSGTTNVFIPVNSASNVMSPVRAPPGQPDTFLTGVHSRVFSVVVPSSPFTQTWRLATYILDVNVNATRLCGNDDQNSRLITYQGKLSDGNQAANGIYDLQFKLFEKEVAVPPIPPSTTPIDPELTDLITVEDVPVTNGVFTVQLNLNATVTPPTIPPIGTPALNDAILGGKGGFFQIGVRPRNSIGAFTVLAPRQPLTAVPLAMRANTAQRSLHATYADLATTATTAINATNATKATNADNATNAANVYGGIVQLPLTSGTPPATECDSSSEYGRQKVDANNSRLYICTAAGWKFTVLQ